MINPLLSSDTTRDQQESGRCYLSTDEDGYLVNIASLANIQPEWQAAVDAVTDTCVTHMGNDLHSVYVCGSVARGCAVHGSSDLDMIALTQSSDTEQSKDWQIEMDFEMKRSFPFITEVELVTEARSNVLSLRGLRRILKLHSACVAGVDITGDLPRMKAGIEVAAAYHNLESEILKHLMNIQSKKLKNQIEHSCAWIMKKIVRTAFELVMEREGRYTTDLQSCYDFFSDYYPEHRHSVFRALQLATTPTTDLGQIGVVVCDVLRWMPQEIKRLRLEESAVEQWDRVGSG